MSVNNAPGEVNNNPNFDSPNISSEEDFDSASNQDEMVEEQAEQKQRETVDIDGIPFSKEEIKYKASDIRKKGRVNYFVNIEGAEEHEKTAAKEREAEKISTERRVRDAENIIQKHKRAEQEAANKKLVEEKKRAEEVKKYIKKQKAAKDPKKHELQGANKTSNPLFSGWHKFLTLGIAVIFIAVVICIPLLMNHDDKGEEGDNINNTIGSQLSDALKTIEQDKTLKNAFENYDFDEVDDIYDHLISNLDNNIDKATLYINKAQKIRQYDKTEQERILAAAEWAYVLASDDENILNGLYDIYSINGYDDKAEEIFAKLRDVSSKEEYEGDEEDLYGEG